MAHNVRPAPRGRTTPSFIERPIQVNMPKSRAGFSWASACKGAAGTLAVPPLGSCLCSITRAETVANVVTCVHLETTPVFCSSQGSPGVFSQRSKKVERQIRQELRPPSPHHCHSRDLACGGLQPSLSTSPPLPRPEKGMPIHPPHE